MSNETFVMQQVAHVLNVTQSDIMPNLHSLSQHNIGMSLQIYWVKNQLAVLRLSLHACLLTYLAWLMYLQICWDHPLLYWLTLAGLQCLIWDRALYCCWIDYFITIYKLSLCVITGVTSVLLMISGTCGWNVTCLFWWLEFAPDLITFLC
jgi:hypothetical protein